MSKKELILTTIQIEKLSVIYNMFKGYHGCNYVDLSDEHKLWVATSLKHCPNATRAHRQPCYGIDWLSLGFTLTSKEYEAVWAKIAEMVEGCKVQFVCKRSIPKSKVPFDTVDPAEIAKLDENAPAREKIYDLYEATGKITHADLLSEVDLKTRGDIVELVKKFKPNLEDLARLQKFINASAVAQVGNISKKTALPNEVQAKKDELMSITPKFLELTKSNMIAASLYGYVFGSIKFDLDEEGDFINYRKGNLVSPTVLNESRTKSDALGLVYAGIEKKPVIYRTSNVFIQHGLMLGWLVEHYNEHRDIIRKYIDNPKPWYIYKKNKEQYAYNYYHITLDIYMNENIVIPPMVFYLITNMKEPLECLQ